MSLTREFPVPTLHRMIADALQDLKQARNLDDTNRMTRAEIRMNTLLEQLGRRSAPGTSPRESAA
ncbi:hypothetical protein [Amycolatopsis taiwanensis]|uniref:Uncharacterized protein n=1 Tax=Amycolatopsis taiwanensis TaxID=342230 RepID=A0A9W6QZC6_9PSEU|nr:hypothetical protein [Amycolatopsis taiwanensis]GLY66483.1 hypothetical protein Atai01_31020 [Amycolatopsis taiwanensis]